MVEATEETGRPEILVKILSAEQLTSRSDDKLIAFLQRSSANRTAEARQMEGQRWSRSHHQLLRVQSFSTPTTFSAVGPVRFIILLIGLNYDVCQLIITCRNPGGSRPSRPLWNRNERVEPDRRNRRDILHAKTRRLLAWRSDQKFLDRIPHTLQFGLIRIWRSPEGDDYLHRLVTVNSVEVDRKKIRHSCCYLSSPTGYWNELDSTDILRLLRRRCRRKTIRCYSDRNSRPTAAEIVATAVAMDRYWPLANLRNSRRPQNSL